MVLYKNLNMNSNVQFYEICPQSIRVKFYKTNKVYSYSYVSAGKAKVEYMKFLARRGFGLNSFINRFCKYSYDKNIIG